MPAFNEGSDDGDPQHTPHNHQSKELYAMKHEPCCRCLNIQGGHTSAHYDVIHRAQYALCLDCQRDTGTGVQRQRLPSVGSECSQW